MQRNLIDSLYEQNRQVLAGLGIAGVMGLAGLTHVYNTLVIEYGSEDALPILLGSGVVLVVVGTKIVRHRKTVWQMLFGRRSEGAGDNGRMPDTVMTPPPVPVGASNDLTGWTETVSGLGRINRPVLPVGVDAITGRAVWLDMSKDPHLVLTGKSGEGKTRRFLRPLVGAAYATGWQVVVLDETGQHYTPFMNRHKNVQVVATTAETLLPVVTAVYQQVLDRSEEMTRLGAERYVDMRADRRFPRLLVVLDEYSNLIGQLRGGGNKSAAEAIERKVIQIAQRGRSTEVHLVVVAQRGTSDNINTTLRQECTPASFYLGKKAEYQYMNLIVPDDDIQSGQMAIAPRRSHHVVNCWHPDNAEIARFMSDPTVYSGRVYDEPTWIPDYEYRVFDKNGRSQHYRLTDHQSGDHDEPTAVTQGKKASDQPRDRARDHAMSGKNPSKNGLVVEFNADMPFVTLETERDGCRVTPAPVPEQVERLASPAATEPSGKRWVELIAPYILEDRGDSAIPSVTAGQVRLIYFALQADLPNRDIYPLVWGTPSRGGLRLAAINSVKAMIGDATTMTMVEED